MKKKIHPPLPFYLSLEKKNNGQKILLRPGPTLAPGRYGTILYIGVLPYLVTLSVGVSRCVSGHVLRGVSGGVSWV